MTTIYLVRHAVTAITGQRLTPPEIPLSDEGRTQAGALAASLADVPFKAIYASPLPRTMQTATPIAKRHGLSITTKKNLVDVDYGRWAGRPLRAVARTKLWSVVQRWPSAARFPEGETLREVQVRSIDAMEEIREEWPRATVCCVTHADVIRLVMAHYIGTHIDLYQRIVIAPASTSIIALHDTTPVVFAINVPPRPQEASEGPKRSKR